MVNCCSPCTVDCSQLICLIWRDEGQSHSNDLLQNWIWSLEHFEHLKAEPFSWRYLNFLNFSRGIALTKLASEDCKKLKVQKVTRARFCGGGDAGFSSSLLLSGEHFSVGV